MKCRTCNSENSDVARFCEQCGTALEESTSQTIPVQESETASGHIAQSETATIPQNTAAILQNTAAIPQNGAAIPQNGAAVTYINPPKRSDGSGLFVFLQMIIYLALAAGSIAFIFFEKGASVNSLFDSSVSKDFSFIDIITSLIFGTARANPTSISIIMGITAIILTFGSAIFWVTTFFTRAFKKSYHESHVMAVIFTILNSVVIALLAPLASRFSGMLKQACAKKVNMLIDDVGSISSVWAIVFAVICIALIVAELIFASKEKKCHKKSEE